MALRFGSPEARGSKKAGVEYGVQIAPAVEQEPYEVQIGI
jgi:hypothetical protein